MSLGYAILVHVVWFLSTYFVVFFMLSIFTNKNKFYSNPTSKLTGKEKVTILVPAYNEQDSIKDTLASLEAIDYPKSQVEIIVINDGSKDNTAKEITEYIKNKKIRFINNKTNKGKASCLNQGIKLAKGSFIACMDADSIVEKDILKKMLPHFKDKKVGAVTVTVELKKVDNFLEKIIQLEYIFGLSLLLKITSMINCTHVTPGPFSIYNRKVLDEIGYFDTKNITEDLEIAYRIHKHGYKIENCMTTSVKTLTPNNLKSLYRQRRRWYSGALLTLWKHKSMFAGSRAGLFSFFVPFNYALIGSGLALFITSIYMTSKSISSTISHYALTNYNFLSSITWKVDILSHGMFLMFGLSGIFFTILLITYGLSVSRKNIRKRPAVYAGYFLLFFLYQVYWISSLFTVLTRRKVKW